MLAYHCSVNDVFDHSVYDSVIKEWDSNYLFPYKLGNFRKRLLCQPTCIATMKYHLPAEEVLKGNSKIGSGSSSSTGGTCGVIDNAVEIPVLPDVEGVKCHCVAIWVDYQLTVDQQGVDMDGNVLKLYTDRKHVAGEGSTADFPLYSTVYLKYFSVPSTVSGSGDASNSILASVKFAHGDNDFKFDFAVI